VGRLGGWNIADRGTASPWFFEVRFLTFPRDHRARLQRISLQPPASNSRRCHDMQKVYIYLDNRNDPWYSSVWLPRNSPSHLPPAPKLKFPHLSPLRAASGISPLSATVTKNTGGWGPPACRQRALLILRAFRYTQERPQFLSSHGFTS
jgi:hypothetical protein